MSAEEPRRRRTGRHVLRIGVLSVFTGLSLLVTVVVVIDWLQAVDTYFWEPATCTIESSRVTERPDYDDFVLEVSYSYGFHGRRYVGDAYRHAGAGFSEIAEAERQAARYTAGAEVPCWVDADDPHRSYLRRANLWRGFHVLIPLVFVAIGGGMLWMLYGPSPKREGQPESVPGTGGRILRSIKSGALPIGFFGVFFLFGVGFLVPAFLLPALQVLEARSWEPVPCEILESGVRTHPGEDSATYSVEVLYRYTIDGREHRSGRYQFLGGSSSGYEAKAEAVAEIPVGAEITCWVDPEDPFDAVIERGFTAGYLFGLVPLLFAGVGLGGIVFVVAAMRGMKKDAARPSWPKGIVRLDDREVATVARAEPVTLEPQRGPWAKLGCTIVMALFWNGFISLFVWHVVQSWRAGDPEWGPTLILIPFVLIGLLLLAGIPFGILALVNPRPRLRLDRDQIVAGEPFDISWTFKGASHRVHRLKIWLERSRTTTEVEVHDSGGSVRTYTELADTIEVLDRGREGGLEFGSVSFTLPAGVPPTSEGDTANSWKLKLQGYIAYWPDVAEEYEITVLPPPGGDF